MCADTPIIQKYVCAKMSMASIKEESFTFQLLRIPSSGSQ